MKLLNWSRSIKVTFKWSDAALPDDMAWVKSHRADWFPSFLNCSFSFYFLLHAVVWSWKASQWLFVFYWFILFYSSVVVIDRDKSWFWCFASHWLSDRAFAYIGRWSFTCRVERHRADWFTCFGNGSFRFYFLLLAIIRPRIYLFVTLNFLFTAWGLKLADFNLTRLILIFIVNNSLSLW